MTTRIANAAAVLLLAVLCTDCAMQDSSGPAPSDPVSGQPPIKDTGPQGPALGNFTDFTCTVTAQGATELVTIDSTFLGTLSGTPPSDPMAPAFTLPIQISLDGGAASTVNLPYLPAASAQFLLPDQPTGPGSTTGPNWTGQIDGLAFTAVGAGAHTVTVSMAPVPGFSGVLPADLAIPFQVGGASAAVQPLQGGFDGIAITAGCTSGLFIVMSDDYTGTTTSSDPTQSFSLGATVQFDAGAAQPFSAAFPELFSGGPYVADTAFTLPALANGLHTITVVPAPAAGFSGTPLLPITSLVEVSLPPRNTGALTLANFHPLSLQASLVQSTASGSSMTITAFACGCGSDAAPPITSPASFTATCTVSVDGGPASSLPIAFSSLSGYTGELWLGHGAVEIGGLAPGVHAVTIAPDALPGFTGGLPPPVTWRVEIQPLAPASVAGNG